MKTKVTLESCDNPTCNYDQVVDKEGASGYHFGQGHWVLAGGGPIPAFYAHSRACILPAFDAVMEANR